MSSAYPIILSLKVALLSALLTLPWGIVWGWVLARKSFRGKVLIQTLLYCPLVLPPVLTGYFLLFIFSPRNALGKFLWETWAIRFVFDWKGAVAAAVVVSSPFMIQSVKDAVARVDQRLEMAASTLGAGFFKVMWTITLPLAWPGIAAGFMMAFARSIGEFGATVMVAGNIPGKTQTVPLAIYSHVYLGREAAIWPLVLAAFIFAYAGLAVYYFFNNKTAY